jgi:large subunit ribosomal protein L24
MDAGRRAARRWSWRLQTTLLGLAIAIILALVAALVGPLLIDWGGYRAVFQTEASRLIGADVRVTGAIEARLLPSPQLTLHDIEIGRGNDKISARSLGIEFALGPLMRGEWRAAEMHLTGPRFRLSIDAAGHVRTPNIAINFSPDSLSIDRLSIEDGTVAFGDAENGTGVMLEKLWFNGEARSLLGPFKGEGAATVGGELYPFRLSTGRAGEDGALKLHLNIDPVSHPLSIEADGSLALAGGEPRFDGTWSLTRPVGIAASSPATPNQPALSQPWRVSGKIKARAASALLQQIEFQYGSDEQGFKLTGTAEFKFGKVPRFDSVLSGRQIDLDRTLGLGETNRLAPAGAVNKLAELAAAAFRPTFPIQIGIGIDQVTLGGDTIQSLRGDISTDAGGWNLDRFEFRAPGFTQVRLSGHLAVDADGAAFTGPAEVAATDPKAFAAWVEGRAAPAQSDLRPLRVRGDVTLSTARLAIDRLNAEFERKSVTGRLAYAFAAGKSPARLEAELNAPELDVAAAFGFGKAIVAGSKLGWPRDMTIAADIGRASFADIEAGNTSVRLKVDGDGLQIDRLSIADLAGGAFSASGRIDIGGHAPRGALTLDFEARQTAAIAALIGKFAPNSARPVAGALDRIGHAKLHATLDIADGKDGVATVAKLAAKGDLDAMHLDANAAVSGDWAKRAVADIRLGATVDAPDGAALVKLVGLDAIVAAGKGPGRFKLAVAGTANGELNLEARLTADGLDADGQGHGSLSLDRGAKLTGSLHLTKADLRPLRPAGDTAPLPLSLSTRLAVAGRVMSFDDIDAKLGASSIRGHLTFADASPRRIDGALDADTTDASALIATIIGSPAPAPALVAANAATNATVWLWSSDPFSGGAFADLSGQIALKAARLVVTPRLRLREFRAGLRFGKDSLALDDIAATLAGGRIGGALSLRATGEGLAMQSKMVLTGADVATLLPAAARPPVTGTIDLTTEIAGAGLSPAALIGSLHGTGKLTLDNGQFAGLDPRAFDAVSRAVDDGLSIDAAKIASVVSRALDSGQLSIKHTEGNLVVSAGQVRLSEAKAHGEDADVSIAGNLDLTDGSLAARLVLSGSRHAGGVRPDIFMALKGPVAAPTRSVDVSALTGWLTLRAIESQSRKLQELEKQRAAEIERQRAAEIERQRAAEIEKQRAAERARQTLPPPPSPPAGAPAAGSQNEMAPVLPAPIDIGPLPAPAPPAIPEAQIGKP